MPIVDRRIWSLVGARGVPLVWAERNARVFPCPPDSSTHERLDLAQHRAAQLRAATSYPQAGSSRHPASSASAQPYSRRLVQSQFNAITGSAKQQPQSYIVSNADDLLGLFDADFGVLVIGEGAKILGPNEHGQEVLVVAEYLRLKHFSTIQVSQAVTKDFSDLQLLTGLEVIAGLLFVPLSKGGSDFIALLRKGQPRAVRWAGRPYKDGADGSRGSLEPRASFRVWSETVAGQCRAWSDDQLETAGMLALVYGKVRRDF